MAAVASSAPVVTEGVAVEAAAAVVAVAVEAAVAAAVALPMHRPPVLSSIQALVSIGLWVGL